MPYNPQRRVSGPRDDGRTVSGTRGLLHAASSDLADSHDPEQLVHPASREVVRTFTMGFKDWKQRVAFFRGPAERSPREQDLVLRLDIYLMTFGCSKGDTRPVSPLATGS